MYPHLKKSLIPEACKKLPIGLFKSPHSKNKGDIKNLETSYKFYNQVDLGKAVRL